MNDDREVTCYALLTQHLDGQDVRDAARSAWFAQRDLDDGCQLLATTLFEARCFKPADAWQKARLAIESNRPRVASAAAALVRPGNAADRATIVDNPARCLRRRPHMDAGAAHELELLALMRLAATRPGAAAGQLQQTWGERLPRRAARHRLGARRQAGRAEAAAAGGGLCPPRLAALGRSGAVGHDTALERRAAGLACARRAAPATPAKPAAGRWWRAPSTP